MKNRLSFPILFTCTASTLASAVQVDVMMEDGFKASGELIALDAPQDSLTILPTGNGKTPWDIKLSQIHSIHMEQPRKNTQDKYPDIIVLRGGWREILPASLKSIEHGKAVFTSPYRHGTSVISKNLIRAIKLNDPKLFPILADLPSFDIFWIPSYQKSLQEQQMQCLEKANPNHQPGSSLVLPSGTEWGKNMDLNAASFDLRLDVSIPLAGSGSGRKDRLVLFFGGDGTRSPMSNPSGLYLHTDGVAWKLSYSDSPLTSHTINSLPIPKPGSRHRLFLSVTETPRGTSFSLSADGHTPRRTVVPWVAPSGTWFTFAIPQGQVELYGLRLFNKWDIASNILPSDNTREDKINTTDGKTIVGDITSYQDRTNVVTIKTPQRPMEIPSEYTSLMVFSNADISSPSDKDTEGRDSVVLQNGGRLYGSIRSLNKGILILDHPVLGTLTIPGQDINRLDFFNQEPPTRSTP